jgi:hypothetical protein
MKEDTVSTVFVTDAPIPYSELKNLNHMDIRMDEDHGEGGITLTDGKNYLWASPYNDFVMFTRYGRNDPEKILVTVMNYFKVAIYSEYDKEYREIVGYEDDEE